LNNYTHFIYILNPVATCLNSLQTQVTNATLGGEQMHLILYQKKGEIPPLSEQINDYIGKKKKI